MLILVTNIEHLSNHHMGWNFQYRIHYPVETRFVVLKVSFNPFCFVNEYTDYKTNFWSFSDYDFSGINFDFKFVF